MKKFGRCLRCADFPRGCTDEDTRDMFMQECPKTCKVCHAMATDAKALPEESEAKDNETSANATSNASSNASSCEDTPGDFCSVGRSFCVDHKFQVACPRTCALCAPEGARQGCTDLYSVFTCAR